MARRVQVLASQVTAGLISGFSGASSPRSLADLPGPLEEDSTAYNGLNHHYLTQLHETHGDLLALTRGGERLVLVRRPDLVRRVLHDCEDFNKTWSSSESSSQTVDYVMNLIQPLLRSTIFNMHGGDNAMRRAKLRPTFLGKQQFARACEQLIPEALADWPLDSVADIQDLCHDLTRRCMLIVVCGDFAREAFTCLPVFHDVMNYFVQRYSAIEHGQTVTAEDDVQMSRLHDAALEVVQMFKIRLAGSAEPSPLLRRALLFNCVRADLGDEEMANTLVNVLIAAGEAPASGLAQTLEELARSPETQRRLRAEAKKVAQPYCDHIEELELASGCINEGMRLFAPATLVQRQAMRDTLLDNVHIPKGTVVGVCVHSVHNDEKVWPEANKFNPMRRGLDYETSEGYVAFGGGPRGCPGKHAAMAICKVALPLIVSKFELATVPDAPPSQQCTKVPKFVEWSVQGIPLRLSSVQ